MIPKTGSTVCLRFAYILRPASVRSFSRMSSRRAFVLGAGFCAFFKSLARLLHLRPKLLAARHFVGQFVAIVVGVAVGRFGLLQEGGNVQLQLLVQLAGPVVRHVLVL